MSFKILFSLLLSFSLVALPVNADNQSAAALKSFPDYAGKSVSEHFDADKIAQLESRMHKFVSDGDTYGIATLLMQDGKVVSHTQAGIRNLMKGAPITEDTIYRIYSMTKPVTGVAMMMLYEKGKFSLDDPVSKYIPEFADLQVVKSYTKEGEVELEDLQRQPTMRELMSHTAGFAYGLYGDDPSNRGFMQKRILFSPDLQTFIDKVSTVPLMFQPGEKWFYSAAVDIQGAIVERLSGMSFGEFLKSRLFDPLGMSDTGFYVPEDKYSRFSNVFGFHPETKKFQLLPFGEEKYNILGDMMYKKGSFGMESGGGGLVATLGDYARFCQMLANGGELNGHRIIKAETIKLMRTNVLKEGQSVDIQGVLRPADSPQIGFGLDFGVLQPSASGKAVTGEGSYFWGGAAGTWFWIDPTNNFYFIGMIQRFPQGGPEVDFRGISQKMVYEALVPK
ncbi:MAG: serine hydrolase domain-containing protein [Pseudomonadota bacterium]